MGKKFWISGIAAVIVTMVCGMLVHGVWLGAEYNALGWMRTEEAQMGYMPYMILAHVSLGFAAAWIYVKGMTAGASWLGQGVRFGIAITFLMSIPMFLIYYSILPIPGMLVVKQIIGDAVCWIIAGIVIAFLNKE